MTRHPLDPLFHPRATALFGVSASTSGSGGASGFLGAILEQGYQDEHGVYPINPKATEIAGLPCYPSLLDTPDPVDHVISLVPSAVVPELVDQAIRKGVRSVHFFTAGFSETGDEERTQLERDMVARLTGAGIRVIGPNCMGIYVPGGLAFMGSFPTDPGNVMVISQSGANAGDIIHSLGKRGVRFSKAVSFGNGSDIRAHHLFDYAAADPDTEVVVAYLEGIQDGRDLFAALKRCAAVKPTILLKGGLTAAGARAAHSHTGSLAGSREIFDALCRQVGAMRAETMDELHDLVVGVTTRLRTVSGTGVALISRGGGNAVLSADALAAQGLDVPPLPQAAKDELHTFIPLAGTSVNNPIDPNMLRPEAMDRVIRTVAAVPTIDAVFVTTGGSWGPDRRDRGDEIGEEELRERAVREAEESAAQLAESQERAAVPVVAVQRGAIDEAAERFAEDAYRQGIAVFRTVHRAARATSLLMQWRRQRRGLPELF